MKLNPYKITRNQSTENGFFRVNVEEINLWGFGFQLYIGGVVYGFSITNS